MKQLSVLEKYKLVGIIRLDKLTHKQKMIYVVYIIKVS